MNVVVATAGLSPEQRTYALATAIEEKAAELRAMRSASEDDEQIARELRELTEMQLHSTAV